MNDDYQPLSMPGSFPRETIREDVPNDYTAADMAETPAARMIDEQVKSKFIDKQIISNKTRAQQNLIGQLEMLVYILTGYQFIKYCHSACLIPAILHIVVQKLLSCGAITENDSNAFVHAIIAMLQREEEASSQSREQIVTRLVIRTGMMVYLKALFTLAYHLLFLTTWELSVAKSGKIAVLENGTWWFVSFIGEFTMHDIGDLQGTGAKLLGLGGVGLIVSDFIILFIQIILFQCIFKQSNVVRSDRAVGEKEVYIVRASNDNSGLIDSDCLKDEIPLILSVRLYESWNIEA